MNFNHIMLVATPSFEEGLARIVDFGGTLNEYNTSLTTGQADYLAMVSDWKAVGDSIRKIGADYASNSTLINEEK